MLRSYLKKLKLFLFILNLGEDADGSGTIDFDEFIQGFGMINISILIIFVIGPVFTLKFEFPKILKLFLNKYISV